MSRTYIYVDEAANLREKTPLHSKAKMLEASPPCKRFHSHSWNGLIRST